MTGDELHDPTEQMRKGLVFRWDPQNEAAFGPERRKAPFHGKGGVANAVPDPLSTAAKVRFEDIPTRGLICDGFDHLLRLRRRGRRGLAGSRRSAHTQERQAARVSSPETQLFGVYWDGRQVWVASRLQGIFVLSLDGKIVAKIGADQGLPPADRAMLLHVLAGQGLRRRFLRRAASGMVRDR